LNQSNYFSAEDEIENKKNHHMDIRDRHQNIKTRKNGPLLFGFRIKSNPYSSFFSSLPSQ
jgi:hypothetical protein